MKSAIFIGAALLMLTAGCAGSNDSADANAAAPADSTAVVDSVEAAVPDLLVTPDLTLLEVKGNVKEIKGKESGNYVYGGSAKFDTEGKLTHYGNSEPIDKLSNIKRDDAGRLTAFLASEWTSVKWEADRPASAKFEYNEMATTDTYKYNADGRLIEITRSWQDLCEETEESAVGTVTYPADAFDANGNWIKRIVKYPDHTETQEREIIYY